MSLNIQFLELLEAFVGAQKPVWISHGKQATGVQAIKVQLYLTWSYEVIGESTTF